MSADPKGRRNFRNRVVLAASPERVSTLSGSAVRERPKPSSYLKPRSLMTRSEMRSRWDGVIGPVEIIRLQIAGLMCCESSNRQGLPQHAEETRKPVQMRSPRWSHYAEC